MIIVVSDHAGFETKQQLLSSHFLDQYDSHIINLNPEYNPDDDYPDNVAMITSIKNYTTSKIIAFCGSGQGVCMALNKIPYIRAGLGYDIHSAHIIRNDNDAQAICLGARTQNLDDIKKIIDTFLQTPASTEIRHQRRVAKLDKLANITID